MPSTVLTPLSGGVNLVSGNVLSGTAFPFGGITLKMSTISGTGPVYVGVGNPTISGGVVTVTSGGSLTSGGMLDGVELVAGDTYFVPKSRLGSGVTTIMVGVPATSSGSRLFWDYT